MPPKRIYTLHSLCLSEHSPDSILDTNDHSTITRSVDDGARAISQHEIAIQITPSQPTVCVGAVGKHITDTVEVHHLCSLRPKR